MKKTFFSLRWLIVFLVGNLLLTGLISCMKEKSLETSGPAPAPVISQSSSQNSMEYLGRVLFYDKNLSLNSSTSCGSCHKQQYAFADNRVFSLGLNNRATLRNTSTLLGGNHPRFWDGRAASTDSAVFLPVQNHSEMDIFDLKILEPRLTGLGYYNDLFKNAFGDSVINTNRIRQALSVFVQSLNSGNSRFDNGYQSMGISEKRGYDIFIGKGKCSHCHSGSNFNGYPGQYENIGLEVSYADKGRGGVTRKPEDAGSFNVPPLRNISLTAPYMHDGRYKTLREVIDHYSDGIQDDKYLSWVFREIPPGIDLKNFNQPHELSQFPVKKLNLTEQEKKDLESFLNALTDVRFITNPRYANPFVK